MLTAERDWLSNSVNALTKDAVTSLIVATRCLVAMQHTVLARRRTAAIESRTMIVERG